MLSPSRVTLAKNGAEVTSMLCISRYNSELIVLCMSFVVMDVVFYLPVHE